MTGAVYLAILLHFVRRLLRRVLSPAGGRPVGSGRYRLMCLEIAGRGYGMVVGGPWEIPEGKTHDIEGNVSVWSEELPDGLRLRLIETNRQVGSLPRFCMDVGVGSTGELQDVGSTVDCCLKDIRTVLGID